MKRRLCISGLSSLILLLLLALPALAGGWTSVTLDQLPTDARAGTGLTLGFMVRQHGKTPISDVSPVLKARNASTGETISAPARQEGPVGHFVVDVTFPSAGDWRWSVTPVPFGEVDLGGVAILPAGAAAPQGAAQPAPLAAGRGFAANALASAPLVLRWGGALVLLLALGLGVWSQRTALVRRRPLRAR